MILGFTGTRQGMKLAQKGAVMSLLRMIQATELHHGDCVGADAEAHDIAVALHIAVVIHPPADPTHRAYKEPRNSSYLRPAKTHFARNRDIVDTSDKLIATPWQTTRPPPKIGGGTWYTVEYAEKRGKRVAIVWPDGRIEIIDTRRKVDKP